MDLDDTLPPDAARDAEWAGRGEGSQDVERVTAGDLVAGDVVVIDGAVVTLESVMRSGDTVWVSAGGEKLRAPADGEVERLKSTE